MDLTCLCAASSLERAVTYSDNAKATATVTLPLGTLALHADEDDSLPMVRALAGRGRGAEGEAHTLEVWRLVAGAHAAFVSVAKKARVIRDMLRELAAAVGDNEEEDSVAVLVQKAADDGMHPTTALERVYVAAGARLGVLEGVRLTGEETTTTT